MALPFCRCLLQLVWTLPFILLLVDAALNTAVRVDAAPYNVVWCECGLPFILRLG